MKADIAIEAIVGDLIAKMEAGAGQWRMPWHHNGGMPINVISRKPYRGGNHVVLMLVGTRYTTNEWGTYKQWQLLDTNVRKGEHGTIGIYWNRLEPKEGETKGRLVARAFPLFNADQVDGYTPAPTPTNPDPQSVGNFFLNIPFRMILGAPSYSPIEDVIRMPLYRSFTNEAAYDATMAHELAHWTGHQSRLKRELLGGRWGDNAYAFEGLIAELSAAFTCAHLGIATERRTDHAQYLSSWCAGLKTEPSILWSVASKAQAATDHLISYQPEESDDIRLDT